MTSKLNISTNHTGHPEKLAPCYTLPIFTKIDFIKKLTRIVISIILHNLYQDINYYSLFINSNKKKPSKYIKPYSCNSFQ